MLNTDFSEEVTDNALNTFKAGFCFINDYYIVDNSGKCKLTEKFKKEIDNNLWNGKKLPNIPREAISLENLFFCCKNVKELDLSLWDTSNVEDMSFMFISCYKLKYLNIPFNTINVKDMSGMFASCYSLEYLNLSTFITTNVGDISAMFFKCRSLEYLNLSSFIMPDNIVTDKIFLGCSSIRYIYNTDENTNKMLKSLIN